MPAVHFNVVWPDGESRQYYSPSTVLYEHLSEGEAYSTEDFSKRVFSALNKASERVQQKYGFACSAAADEALKIQKKLTQLEENNIDGEIIVKSFS